MVFHLLYNTLLISPALAPSLNAEEATVPVPSAFHPIVIAFFSVAAGLLLAFMGRSISSRERNNGSRRLAQSNAD